MKIWTRFFFAIMCCLAFKCQVQAQGLPLLQNPPSPQANNDPLDDLLTLVDHDQNPLTPPQPIAKSPTSIQPSQNQTAATAAGNPPCGNLICDEQVIEQIIRAFLSNDSSLNTESSPDIIPTEGGYYQKKRIFIPSANGRPSNMFSSTPFPSPMPHPLMGMQNQNMQSGCPCGQNNSLLNNMGMYNSNPYGSPPINQMFFQMPCGGMNGQGIAMEGYPYSASSIFNCIDSCVGKLPMDPNAHQSYPSHPTSPNQMSSAPPYADGTSQASGYNDFPNNFSASNPMQGKQGKKTRNKNNINAAQFSPNGNNPNQSMPNQGGANPMNPMSGNYGLQGSNNPIQPSQGMQSPNQGAYTQNSSSMNFNSNLSMPNNGMGNANMPMQNPANTSQTPPSAFRP